MCYSPYPALQDSSHHYACPFPFSELAFYLCWVWPIFYFPVVWYYYNQNFLNGHNVSLLVLMSYEHIPNVQLSMKLNSSFPVIVSRNSRYSCTTSWLWFSKQAWLITSPAERHVSLIFMSKRNTRGANQVLDQSADVSALSVTLWTGTFFFTPPVVSVYLFKTHLIGVCLSCVTTIF